jgi:hypothetical protein
MPKERKIKNPPNRANTTVGLKCANNNPELSGLLENKYFGLKKRKKHSFSKSA